MISPWQRISRMEKELFHKGTYPDVGLRQWAREWRRELREAIASLGMEASKLRREVSELKKEVGNQRVTTQALLDHLKVDITIHPSHVVETKGKITPRSEGERDAVPF